MRFETGPAIPRQWPGRGRAVTPFFNNLSVFFPPGERFFIASVKAHRQAVTDPELQKEIRAFCGQEGIHTREHEGYNAMLEAQGYPVAAMEKRVVELLDFVTRITPKRWQLAATCALEHFTALLADLLLGNPSLMNGANPTMAELWRWHAAEENEHKAVAFDVYTAAGGNTAERSLVMVFASIIFWAKVLEHQVRLMRHDGILFSLREWASLVRYLTVTDEGKPGIMLALIRPYLDYYRPSFHPWNHDNRALLEAWKAEYAA